MNDIIGIGAILGAGYVIGYNVAPGQSFSTQEYILIAVLLGIGFFFAVVLAILGFLCIAGRGDRPSGRS